MTICNLRAFQFRNLADTNIVLHPLFNFFVGENGSGKTSVLEALFILGHGKSFRTINTEQIIQHHQDSFVVTVNDNNNNHFGFSKTNYASQILLKINGSKVSKLSDLVKNFAVQVVTPESFVLFFGGPKARRKFIDLGLFHVEPTFSLLWRDCTKILKQRNACLKSRSSVAIATLDYWSNSFNELAIQVAQYRSHYVSLLTTELTTWLQLLLPEYSNQVNIVYYQGWTAKKTLIDVLMDNYHREIKAGFSLAGPHRFDVKFEIDNCAVEHRLSRGQQKLFLLALTFAQTQLIAKVEQIKPILLIDDFGAELDDSSRQLLANAIRHLNCQVIITAIDEQVLKPIIPNNKNYHMFHMKHGEITAIN